MDISAEAAKLKLDPGQKIQPKIGGQIVKVNGQVTKVVTAAQLNFGKQEMKTVPCLNYALLPGFRTQLSQKPKTTFAPLEEMDAIILGLAQDLPSYQFEPEDIGGRNEQRRTIAGRKVAQAKRHRLEKHQLDKEEAGLNETEETDDNITILRGDKLVTRKLTDRAALKAENKARRDEAKWARNEKAEQANKRHRDDEAEEGDEGDAEREEEAARQAELDAGRRVR